MGRRYRQYPLDERTVRRDRPRICGGGWVYPIDGLRLCAGRARFGALEMKGGFPAAVNTAVLSHLVGPRQSLELPRQARLPRALEYMGLVNRLAANEGELADLEKEFVEDLQALDPLAVKLTRRRIVQSAARPRKRL